MIHYKEGGYDPIIKKGVMIYYKEGVSSLLEGVISYYKEGGYDPIIKKGVMILL